MFALELNAPSDNAYVYLEALLHRDRGVTFFAFGQGLGTAQVTRLMHQGALSVLERPLTREVVGPLVIGGIAHSVRRSEETQRWERIQTWLDELTPKEKAVALCAALSADNEQVALKLGCSVRTVEGNRVAINAKISRQAAKDLYASIATYLVVRTELKLPELTGVDVNGLVERSRLTPRW